MTACKLNEAHAIPRSMSHMECVPVSLPLIRTRRYPGIIRASRGFISEIVIFSEQEQPVTFSGQRSGLGARQNSTVSGMMFAAGRAGKESVMRSPKEGSRNGMAERQGSVIFFIASKHRHECVMRIAVLRAMRGHGCVSRVGLRK